MSRSVAPLLEALRGGLADSNACGFVTGTLTGNLKKAQATLQAADLGGELLDDRAALEALMEEAIFAIQRLPHLRKPRPAYKAGHKKPHSRSNQPRLF